MSFKTDHQAVQGLGSAKDGTGHWMSQRLTAIALIPLGAMFLYPFMSNLGEGHAAVLETYSHPFHALIAIGFFVVAFRHARLGIQEIIVDYIHGERTLMLSLIANALVWRGFAIAGAFSVAKIAFTA
ncbi:MAG: succinate dehydrogenase / fumarate reductase membrane anchor subunit [Paracoccaceae bacterium]|jgi:succinate dehydrogenase / fumarate reductase membrane anchor subunit